MKSAFNLRIFLQSLPNLPGVYRMMAKDGTVLYVGKAVNLKRRVNSYFQKNDHSPRIALMIKQIARIDITITQSEAEALILENNLIKSLSPKYNILFRDDKSYPYLMISGHTFPRLAYYRGALKPKNQYFGPYPNGYAVRESIEILQKVFQLRTCEDSVFAHRDRACLLHQIKRCLAPCVGATNEEEYAQQVTHAVAFLNGQTADLMRDLENKMNQAAQELNFEQAAKWRDQQHALGKILSKQFIDSHQSNQKQHIDIIAVCTQNGGVCVHWVSVRSGRYVGDKSFFPKTHNDPAPNQQDYAEAFVAQHYLGRNKPDVLITNFRLPESLKAAFHQEHHKKIHFIHAPKGERKVWLHMAEKNAHNALAQYQLQNSNQQERVAALAQVVKLPENALKRLECFDISHMQGEATIASCVVYDDFAMQPSQYRRYNITTAKKGDDYAAMREVLTRRYSKLLQQENDETKARLPDMVLIDGGKGQLNIAIEVWQSLGLTIPLLGIAKGKERKAGLEELILPDLSSFRLPENHLALLLLQTIRDESHRFAITGHRAKRDKARTQSSLNEINGIGAKRKAALLRRFGGLRDIQAASLSDLASVEGIGLDLAQKIFDYFHST